MRKLHDENGLDGIGPTPTAEEPSPPHTPASRLAKHAAEPAYTCRHCSDTGYQFATRFEPYEHTITRHCDRCAKGQNLAAGAHRRQLEAIARRKKSPV